MSHDHIQMSLYQATNAVNSLIEKRIPSAPQNSLEMSLLNKSDQEGLHKLNLVG